MGRKKGLPLTDKKKEEEEQRGKEQPGQNGRDEEKAPAEKICEAECAVGEREGNQIKVKSDEGKEKGRKRTKERGKQIIVSMWKNRLVRYSKATQ